MTSPLTAEDVAHVARLARLQLQDGELEMFTEQLGKVLAHASDLEKFDIGDVEPMTHPLGLTNVIRPDTVGETLSAEVALSQAPDAEDGQFAVPAILGEAE